MKTALILSALILAGCAAPQQSGQPRPQREIDPTGQIGLELLRMGRPQPMPMRTPTYCRAVRFGNITQMVCD
jgi:PBP1b-binding outer membrane lipoprotein LpoB